MWVSANITETTLVTIIIPYILKYSFELLFYIFLYLAESLGPVNYILRLDTVYWFQILHFSDLPFCWLFLQFSLLSSIIASSPLLCELSFSELFFWCCLSLVVWIWILNPSPSLYPCVYGCIIHHTNTHTQVGTHTHSHTHICGPSNSNLSSMTLPLPFLSTLCPISLTLKLYSETRFQPLLS